MDINFVSLSVSQDINLVNLAVCQDIKLGSQLVWTLT